jgi:hypothetical protein
MDKIITSSSSILCPHTTPVAGTVTPAAGVVTDALTVEGKGVLTGSLAQATVANCPEVTDTNTGTHKCTMVVTEVPGASAVLTVGGTAVLLASDRGTTDGLPLNKWSVTDAKQTVLSAD